MPAAVDSATQLTDASDRLIGSGPAMQSLFKQMGRVAPLDVSVPQSASATPTSSNGSATGHAASDRRTSCRTIMKTSA